MTVTPTGEAEPLRVLIALDGPLETIAAQAIDADPATTVVRRCADVAELLSVAEAGLAAVAVISSGFGRVDTDTVARLRRYGCAVVGVVDPDRDNSERVRALGVDAVVEVSVQDPATGAAGLQAALHGLPAPGMEQAGDRAAGERAGTERAGTDRAGPGHGVAAADWFLPLGPDRRDPDIPDAGYSDPLGLPVTPAAGVPTRRALRSASHSTADGSPSERDMGTDVARADATVITVWGASGAPGRTVTAVTLASELAADGAEVLLVDADTHAASVASYLGMLDESAGIVAGVRAALEGRLRRGVLDAAAPEVMPRLRVLTGITRSARWSELRPAGFETLLAVARQSFDAVVVDVAASVERDEEFSFDVAAPRRNALTLLAIERADALVAVGSADPIGLARLVRALQELQALRVGPRPVVVANRLRASAVGDAPQRRVPEALARFAGITDAVLVEEDRASMDKAVLAGRCLLEAAPGSVIRAPLRRLAARLTSRVMPVADPRRRWALSGR